MGLNDTPAAGRIHIAFFGRRNAGKSSLLNAVTGQELAVVSEIKGTTTDPVYKTMELLPLGPVMLIDTPGFDDEGELGALRIRKTRQVLNKTDLAILVIDAALGIKKPEQELLALIREKEIPHLVVYNKCDEHTPVLPPDTISVSARTGCGIRELKERLGALVKSEGEAKRIVGDLISPSDLIVLVTPIDSAAPKGRLILPQQQTLRDILDADAAAVVVKETQLQEVFQNVRKTPSLVITDSQAFAAAAAATPPEIPLTSFSILMARYKGFLETAVRGVGAIDSLQDGDTILIAEGCTHHRQCDDIGTVKIPRWLRQYTGKTFNIETVSGTEFPENLSKYAMVIHCGGCMLNEREVRYRMKCTIDQGVYFTNYGITIAYIQGILRRSLQIFPHLLAQLPEKSGK
ncbi:MAG: [FeFe] hydrogenase H-cluster maturation GTPase HydF [Clostridia bacterium]